MIVSNDNSLRHVFPASLLKNLYIKALCGSLTVLCYSLLSLSAHAASAPSPTVLADGPVSSDSLIGHIDYYLDPTWNKTVSDMAGADSEKFQPVERNEPDFGYTHDKIWLRISIKNITTGETDWRLHLRENFKQIFDLYIVREDGSIDHTFSLQRDSPFDARPIAFPEMVAPLKINPGETVTVFLNYWSEGSSHQAVSLETVDSFAQIGISRMAKNYIYYGMMVILIIAAFVAMIVLKQPVFPAYIAYTVCAVMFLMHADGIAFQYIWPSFPLFNSVASIVTGGALAFFCANYARVFLQTRTLLPRMDKALVVFMIAVPIICLSAFVIDPQIIKQAMIIVALVTVTLCTLAGILAARTRFREVRFYILAWTGAVFASLIMNMRHIIGVDIAQDLEFDSIRIAMVFDASMMGLAIADRFTHLRRSRQRALQKSLDDAERNLELNSRLRELEEQYVLASELVQSRDEDMKNTVHDLRQPLHALRLNVKNLIEKRNNSATENTNINDTFTYLENLIASHLQDTITTPDMSARPAVTKTADILTTPQILKSIHEMFLPDSAEKGLTFRFVPTRHHARIEHLVLMRIVSNLVANAIKYTSDGKILLGSRRRGENLRIEVHDTGPGMTQGEFENALNREVRLDRDKGKAQGLGYGLAIAKDLSEKHGLKLYQLSERKTGTGIVLEVKLQS